MKYYVETTLEGMRDSLSRGAQMTLDALTEEQKHDLENIMENMQDEWELSEIDDLLDYEPDKVADLLGFESWQHLVTSNESGTQSTVEDIQEVKAYIRKRLHEAIQAYEQEEDEEDKDSLDCECYQLTDILNSDDGTLYEIACKYVELLHEDNHKEDALHESLWEQL